MSSLRLTVLGSCGSYPGPGRACSGYLVRTETTTIALDLGNGTLAALQQHVALAELDAVVLSHEHPDHWVDLAGLRVALRYGAEREGFAVYSTAGTRRAAQALCGELEPPFSWHVIDEHSTVRIGDLDLSFSATQHYVPTLAVRIDGPAGRSLAYSADTGPGWSFCELGTGIDLALCEATSLADEEDKGVLHLSARQAGAMARAAGVARLVLTHLWPEVDPSASEAEGSAAFGAPVEVATDGAELVV